MTETQRNIAVGSTAVAAVVCLIALLLLFGYLPKWMEHGYLLTVKLPNAAGLHDQSRVTYNGIDVGQVRMIELEEPPARGVTVVVMIRDVIKLPADVRVEVVEKLIGGSPTVGLVADAIAQDQAASYLPTDGSAVVNGRVASMMSALVDMMEQPLAKLAHLADGIDELSVEWTNLGRSLTELTEQRPLDQINTGELAGNLASVMARTDSRLAEMKEILQGIDELVSDDKLREDIAATIANSRQMTEAMTEAAQSLTKRYIALADDMSHSLTQMDKAMELARQGEGTVGKLLNDPALYDNFNDASKRLNTAMEQLQLMFEKWKAEGIEVDM